MAKNIKQNRKFPKNTSQGVPRELTERLDDDTKVKIRKKNKKGSSV